MLVQPACCLFYTPPSSFLLLLLCREELPRGLAHSSTVMMARYLLIVLTLSLDALASGTPLASSVPRFDLRSMIEEPIVGAEEAIPKALEIIASLERAPSCHRQATAILISSCRSIEDSSNRDKSKTTDSHLAAVKSSFAARLAICELTEAQAMVPEQCTRLMPARQEDHFFQRIFRSSKGSRKDPGHDALYDTKPTDDSELQKCLLALESRPQWWTSYSNARQNAAVVCHAARHELERGEHSCTILATV